MSAPVSSSRIAAKELTGPFETVEWPERLVGRVVQPGPSPRMCGYDVEVDLAANYRPHETFFLAITGELPSDIQSRRLGIALGFASAVSPGEAATHAAMLARICSGSDSAVIATACVGLAEAARYLVREHTAFIAWLDAGDSDAALPRNVLAKGEQERAAVARLRALVDDASGDLAVLRREIGRDAAILAVFHAAGVRRADQIQSALVYAGLGAALGEAFAVKPNTYREYPMNLPPQQYVENA